MYDLRKGPRSSNVGEAGGYAPSIMIGEVELDGEDQASVLELLAPIYGWFAEGFDTMDLQAAKALLEELP